MRAQLRTIIQKAPKRTCGNNFYPILSITKDRGLVLQNERFKKQIASVDQSKYLIAKKGQLVLSIHLDEGVLSIQNVVEEGIVSPAYKIWDIDESVVRPKYLEYLLKTPSCVDYYKSKAQSSVAGRCNISDSDLLNIELEIPTLEEQDKALSLVEKVSQILKNRMLELEALDDLIKARFVEMFGHQSKNDKGLSYKTIDDVAEIYLGITHTPEYVDDGVVFISAKNTSGDFLDLTDVKHISREEFEGAPAGSKPQKNDVLFSRVGSNLGHPVILEEDIELCTFVSLGFLRTKGMVTSNYLKHWMRDDFFPAQVSEHVKGGGQPNLNTGWLKQFRIIVPSLPEQRAFDSFCSQIDKSKSVIQKSLDETQLLFDSLMQEYFG